MFRGRVVVAGLLAVLLGAIPVWGQTGNDKRPADQGRHEKADEQRERERACDCCMHCMAATRSVQPPDEGPPAKNGCKGCCRRCGTTDLPMKPKAPPEIVK